jgi:hypothetical protein
MQKEDLFLKQLNQFLQFISYLIDSKSNKLNSIDINNENKEFEFIKDFLNTKENFDIFDNNLQALPDIYIYELMLKLLNTQNENVLNLKEKLSFLNLIYVSKSGNFNLQINQKINQL